MRLTRSVLLHRTVPMFFAVWKLGMVRKRYSDQNILKLLREIELNLALGRDVVSACRSVGASDVAYYNWRNRFGGIGSSQLSELRALRKENGRLKKIVTVDSFGSDWAKMVSDLQVISPG